MKISKYWKAVVSGAAAGAASLVTALDDNVITTQEWLTAAVAVAGALGLTWFVPNRTADPKHAAPSE